MQRPTFPTRHSHHGQRTVVCFGGDRMERRSCRGQVMQCQERTHQISTGQNPVWRSLGRSAAGWAKIGFAQRHRVEDRGKCNACISRFSFETKKRQYAIVMLMHCLFSPGHEREPSATRKGLGASVAFQLRIRTLSRAFQRLATCSFSTRHS